MGEGPLTGRLLQPVGLTEAEEDVYRALLSSPGARPAELGRAAGVGRGVARQTLETLAERGLVSRSPGRALRFVPAPPEVALEALILARQEDLDRARLAARELERIFRRAAGRTATADLVEVVVGQRAVADRAAQIERMCEREILELSMPPYAVPPGSQTAVFQALRRGVSYRTVYDRSALEYPGVLEELALFEREGASSRAHPRLPMKLLLGDRRMALVPLKLEEPDQVEGALFVHPSALLEALVVMWEMCWEQGLPIRSDGPHAGGINAESPALSDDDRRLVTFLLGGLKAEAIARRSGMSVSSVERRIRRLLRTVGAETRFQAGFLLAKRLLGGEGSGGADNGEDGSAHAEGAPEPAVADGEGA
ncbi:MAG: TrmB family transcriptional regulator [Actinomycetota bacterium]